MLRQLLALIMATTRTNFWRRDAQGRPRTFLSFKFDPSKVPGLPEPRPMFEIFVYSPRFEGVHMRGGRVARGGLRWSDRPEDFRTEILGLVKAQMVKNVVIVPVGSKGGFVLKRAPSPSDRDAYMKEGIACYQDYLRALLDRHRQSRRRPDRPAAAGEAARPGRSLSRRRRGQGHGDVLRLRERDQPRVRVLARRRVRVRGLRRLRPQGDGHHGPRRVGVGQASLPRDGHRHADDRLHGRGHRRHVGRRVRQRHAALARTSGSLAAFDHRHIFLDPDPDPEAAFRERERLFKLPRSSWADYDAKLLSAGGGIHARSAKSIAITPEVKAALAISADALTPTELVNAILKAPVDLLYNGGIGTYVKSARETHAEVGDRANDALRVDGRDLRCKVVVEGGNLGCTQLGRVEYARAGGRINTDAIDNSGGVGTSDHEVNIKILLGLAVADGELTEKQRNALLAEMTDDVAALVLRDNYFQTQVLSVTGRIAPNLLDAQQRFVQFLEHEGRLNRAIEYLPSDEEFAERRAARQGLASPERAVLLAYSKIWLFDELVASSLPDDPWVASALARYFPGALDRALRRLHGPASAEAGDHRDARDQQHAEPRGQHVRAPAAGIHRRAAARDRPRLPAEPRDLRLRRAVEGDRGARQPRRRCAVRRRC